MRWRPSKAEREARGVVFACELTNERLRDELAVTREERSWQDHVSGMDRLHGRGDNDGGAA